MIDRGLIQKLDELLARLDRIEGDISQAATQLTEEMKGTIRRTLQEIDNVYKLIIERADLTQNFHSIERLEQKIKDRTNKKVFCDIYYKLHTPRLDNDSELTADQQELLKFLYCLDEQLEAVASPAIQGDCNIAEFKKYAEISCQEFITAVSLCDKRIAQQQDSTQNVTTTKLLDHAVHLFAMIVTRSRGEAAIEKDGASICYFPAWFEKEKAGKACLLQAKKLKDILQKYMDQIYQGQQAAPCKHTQLEKKVVQLLVNIVLDSLVVFKDSNPLTTKIENAPFTKQQRFVQRIFGSCVIDKVKKFIASQHNTLPIAGSSKSINTDENSVENVLLSSNQELVACAGSSAATVKVIKDDEAKCFMLSVAEPGASSNVKIKLPPNSSGFFNYTVCVEYALEMLDQFYAVYLKDSRDMYVNPPDHLHAVIGKKNIEERGKWWPAVSDTIAADPVAKQIKKLRGDIGQLQKSHSFFKKRYINVKQQKIQALEYGQQHGFTPANERRVVAKWPQAFSGVHSTTWRIWKERRSNNSGAQTKAILPGVMNKRPSRR